MRKEYKTVLNEAFAEFEERKSRFIAAVKPVSSEEEAVVFIQGLKTRFWDASHHVYAYHIGGSIPVQRFSDDGEPSGTAGLPVLEVVRRMDVQDLAVVVVRYFGGTLLGASGLIRAYGKSASLGIEAARIIRRLLCTRTRLVVEYALWGKVQNLLAAGGYPVETVIYGQDVEIIVYVQPDDAGKFAGLVEEATSARAIVETDGEVYITADMDGKVIKGEECNA